MDSDVLAILEQISDTQLSGVLVKQDQLLSCVSTIEVLLVFLLAVGIFLCGLVFASILVRRWYM